MIEAEESRPRLYSRISNISAVSKMSEKTYESAPFKEELDLDLPYFSPTKYTSLSWRIFHSVNYFLFTAFLFATLGNTFVVPITK